MSKLLQNPLALCNTVRRIALEAGEITMKYYETLEEADVERKEDGSPATRADREAEVHIHEKLRALFPDIPVIGEEAAAAGNLPDLKTAEYFWLVDPLDGTKEFIEGKEDFTVNIALIHKGEPVLGVVYAPAKGVLYAGYGPDTAVRWLKDTDNEKSIHVRREPEEGLTVVSSFRHGDQEKMDGFLKDFKVNKVIKLGSSLKICAIAEGKADLYPRLGPTSEWDTAAGHAVLHSAGGFVLKLDGQALRYGGANEKFLNPDFVASSFPCFDIG